MLHQKRELRVGPQYLVAWDMRFHKIGRGEAYSAQGVYDPNTDNILRFGNIQLGSGHPSAAGHVSHILFFNWDSNPANLGCPSTRFSKRHLTKMYVATQIY